MSAKLKTRNLKLKNPRSTRGIHTQYEGDPDSGKDDAGNYRRTVSQAFFKGRAEGVPENKASVLQSAGAVG